jgi:ATP-dependent DNA ligase
VIGAFYGHGRRSGKYGALLMGVYNSEDDTYESVCKLGTGFTDDILAAMPSMFSERIEKKKPVRVISEMEPDVWIYPSVVMEVIAAEITLSPIHRCAYGILKENAGLALRFPRFTGRFRSDKKPEDATSTREIIEIYKNQKKKS